tara:strand:- start:5738 stop:6556 length:819 start_codon:yes stop_codon:yes gene_type:complete
MIRALLKEYAAAIESHERLLESGSLLISQMTQSEIKDKLHELDAALEELNNAISITKKSMSEIRQSILLSPQDANFANMNSLMSAATDGSFVERRAAAAEINRIQNSLANIQHLNDQLQDMEAEVSSLLMELKSSLEERKKYSDALESPNSHQLAPVEAEGVRVARVALVEHIAATRSFVASTLESRVEKSDFQEWWISRGLHIPQGVRPGGPVEEWRKLTMSASNFEMVLDDDGSAGSEILKVPMFIDSDTEIIWKSFQIYIHLKESALDA